MSFGVTFCGRDTDQSDEEEEDFFSTSTACGACDRYQVCLLLHKLNKLNRSRWTKVLFPTDLLRMFDSKQNAREKNGYSD